jgi:hypothetical protein
LTKFLSRDVVSNLDLNPIIAGTYLEAMYAHPETGEVAQIYTELGSNIMARQILQYFVAMHLYLFDIPLADRQKIEHVYDIHFDLSTKAKIENSK